MKNVRFLTKEEIFETQGGRDSTLRANYDSVRKIVEGITGFDTGFFVNPKSGGEDEDFPDDENKVDVTFGLKDEKTGGTIVVWNYKNGPAYNPSDNLTLSDIPEFSVGFVNNKELSLDLLTRLQNACN